MIRHHSLDRLGLEFLGHCPGDGLGAPPGFTSVIGARCRGRLWFRYALPAASHGTRGYLALTISADHSVGSVHWT